MYFTVQKGSNFIAALHDDLKLPCRVVMHLSQGLICDLMKKQHCYLNTQSLFILSFECTLVNEVDVMRHATNNLIRVLEQVNIHGD